MKAKDDIPFIEHILDSMAAIETFSKGLTRMQFISDRLRHSAIIREIEIIGEAVKNISSQLKNKHKDIEWKEIAGTRDKMIHHYFGIDLDVVWAIVKFDLPNLKKKILKIKKELELPVPRRKNFD